GGGGGGGWGGCRVFCPRRYLPAAVSDRRRIRPPLWRWKLERAPIHLALQRRHHLIQLVQQRARLAAEVTLPERTDQAAVVPQLLVPTLREPLPQILAHSA